MTALVAVLNKTAVALAADSAVTAGRKIYPGPKLFELVAKRPVGVMVFNNLEYMETPWETVIKMYSQASESKEPPCTINGYVEDLLKFIGSSPFRTEAQETRNLIRIATAVFKRILEMLDNTPSEHRHTALPQYIEVVIGENRDMADSMKDIDIEPVIDSHRETLDRLAGNAFESYSLSVDLKRALREAIGLAACSRRPVPGHYTGVVIAGFGQEELFPSLTSLTTNGIVGGKVNYQTSGHVDIARQGGREAFVLPFAQDEMVRRFMDGIDPDFLEYLEGLMSTTMEDFALATLESLGASITASQREAIRDAARRQARGSLASTAPVRQFFSQPIESAVRYLHKGDLADMAESLVGLTALKRHVSSNQTESVGGPIDVAVISKGDGLVWTRRQTYFDPNLNTVS